MFRFHFLEVFFHIIAYRGPETNEMQKTNEMLLLAKHINQCKDLFNRSCHKLLIYYQRFGEDAKEISLVVQKFQSDVNESYNALSDATKQIIVKADLNQQIMNQPQQIGQPRAQQTARAVQPQTSNPTIQPSFKPSEDRRMINNSGFGENLAGHRGPAN